MARRSGAGPAPDPGSLREAARIEAGLIRTLPQKRTGRVPAWPLSTPASASERALWADLWKTPQAILWEEQRVERAVARYVRMSLQLDGGDAPSAKVKVVTEQERTLLLELGSLMKAGYRISVNPVTEPSIASSKPQAARLQVPSARGRLRAVEDVGPD